MWHLVHQHEVGVDPGAAVMKTRRRRHCPCRCPRSIPTRRGLSRWPVVLPRPVTILTHAFGEDVSDEPGEHKSGERGLLRRLEDDDAETRRDLPLTLRAHRPP